MQKKRNMNFFKFLIIFISISALFSCTSLKKIKYLQQESENIENDTIIKTTYILKKGDQLYIDILTSIPEMNIFISGKNAAYVTNITSPNDLYYKSYQIDDSGFVYLPFVGRFKAANKTIDAVQVDINQGISKYVTDALVIVKLANFSVTILGEVNRPGIFYANDNKMNIFEAIGNAGDLNVYGNRKKVTILRKNNFGEYNLLYGDITKANIVQSEIFNLKPNDIVYIEPLATKPFNLGTFPYSTILSTITTLILVINFIK